MKKLNKKGFTLIELIIVIVVIGLLAGMALPKFMGVQRDAKAANLKNDCDVLQTASALIESQRDPSDSDATYGEFGVLKTDTAAVPTGVDLEAAIIKAGGVATDKVQKIDPSAFKDKLSKSVKTGTLADYGVITTGDLAGTVVYLGANADQETGVTDGSGKEYFGVSAYKPVSLGAAADQSTGVTDGSEAR